MNFPLRRRKKSSMGVRDSAIVRSPSYMQHIRGFVCAIFDKPGHECSGRMHAHHCREGADGGTGMKSGDNTCVPLCDLAHAEIHAKGWRTFESKYGIDLSALASKLWHASKHRIAWEQRNG
jgi:hypothetical protein